MNPMNYLKQRGATTYNATTAPIIKLISSDRARVVAIYLQGEDNEYLYGTPIGANDWVIEHYSKLLWRKI